MQKMGLYVIAKEHPKVSVKDIVFAMKFIKARGLLFFPYNSSCGERYKLNLFYMQDNNMQPYYPVASIESSIIIDRT